METSELRVVQADESQLNDLNKLVCALDAGAALKPSQAMRQGLSHFDALNSPTVFGSSSPTSATSPLGWPSSPAFTNLMLVWFSSISMSFTSSANTSAAVSERSCSLVASNWCRNSNWWASACCRGSTMIRLYESFGFRGNKTMLYQFGFDHSNSQP